MKPLISIIIKALNEEDNIERAIRSSLEATKHLDAEVILADSLSTDNTIAIANKYPVKIVQLKNPADRCCGIGPQLGYQHAKGSYIYILDGDMELELGFLDAALNELASDSSLAGVAGEVREMHAVNMIFKRRQKNTTKQIEYPNRLEMGGLYRRKAIEDVGWFSNKNLHAYEEAELGFRLEAKGWKLKRITHPGIKHYGYDTTSFGSFKRRFKTGYVKGSGELLRASFGQSYFPKVILHLKLYIAVIVWWCLCLFVIFFQKQYIQLLFASITIIFLLAFLYKKRSIKEWSFSLVSWHVSAIGMIWGLCSRIKSPRQKIESIVLQ